MGKPVVAESNRNSSPRKSRIVPTSFAKWPVHEHDLFIAAVKEIPRQWKTISKLIGTKTPDECRAYAAKVGGKKVKLVKAKKAPKVPSKQPHEQEETIVQTTVPETLS